MLELPVLMPRMALTMLPVNGLATGLFEFVLVNIAAARAHRSLVIPEPENL